MPSGVQGQWEQKSSYGTSPDVGMRWGFHWSLIRAGKVSLFPLIEDCSWFKMHRDFKFQTSTFVDDCSATCGTASPHSVNECTTSCISFSLHRIDSRTGTPFNCCSSASECARCGHEVFPAKCILPQWLRKFLRTLKKQTLLRGGKHWRPQTGRMILMQPGGLRKKRWLHSSRPTPQQQILTRDVFDQP